MGGCSLIASFPLTSCFFTVIFSDRTVRKMLKLGMGLDKKANDVRQAGKFEKMSENPDRWLTSTAVNLQWTLADGRPIKD